MLNSILNFYKSNGCENLIVSSDAKFVLKNIEDVVDQFIINIIDDARSATFFAYGQAKIDIKPVVMIIKNEFLSNCYTGLTEAWFQQIPLVVVVLTENKKDIYNDFLEPCICRAISFECNEIKLNTELEASLHEKGPTIINVEINNRDRNRDRLSINENIIMTLDTVLGKEDTIMSFGSKENELKNKTNILTLTKNESYGVISKYTGYTLGCKGKCILIAPLELIKLDFNIFNNRYIDSRFKVIFINEKNTKISPDMWIKNNNIECERINSFRESEAIVLANAKNPMVLIVDSERRI